MDCDTIKKDK